LATSPMTYAKGIRGFLFRSTWLVALELLAIARTARASPNYPIYLQQALDAQTPGVSSCVPLCTACHLTAQGGSEMINSFGATMERVSGLSIEQPESAVASALAKVAAARTDSDGDGASDIDELTRAIRHPSRAIQAEGAFCSNLRYGCGTHIASAPPTDRLSLFAWSLPCWASRRSCGVGLVHTGLARPKTDGGTCVASSPVTSTGTRNAQGAELSIRISRPMDPERITMTPVHAVGRAARGDSRRPDFVPALFWDSDDLGAIQKRKMNVAVRARANW
jgi:hypothetical protein